MEAMREAVKSAAQITDAVSPEVGTIPELGNKLDFLFGQATGSEHNIQRSQSMLRDLEGIGLSDTPEVRQVRLRLSRQCLERSIKCIARCKRTEGM